MTGRYLDLESWPRRTLFEFFRVYDQPFFNICTDVKVSELYRRSREPGGTSFFLGTLYASLRAANEVEEFRLRLRGERVWRHDRIHGNCTVLREDESFGFGYFEFTPDYRTFEANGRREIERVRRVPGVEPQADRDDLIHYSVLPWFRFTSFTHARRSDAQDSIPKIVFGKHFEREAERWLPISIEVHHALADGLHVGQFLDRLGAYLAEPPS
ncbi:MAG: chloramphenicol acetyltransferase [Gemmatimonadetes bacterium]|nr:chloramphenicol acetyltransferase [Gemmatimonadota bacterium]